MPTDTHTTENQSIQKNIALVMQRIEEAAKACGRDPNHIQLLCVSKTKPVSDIIAAYNSGHRLFGENYVQEAVNKIQELKNYSDILWHFIGPLQSNKSKFIAEYFDWMHSLDRFKIAKRLNEQRSVHQSPLNVCVQVNIDNEPNKAGVLEKDAFTLVEQLNELSNIQCRGLMTIPKVNANETERRDSFARMQALYIKCAENFDNFDTLSMGMSTDLDIAIEYGSTMVRIGTDIFGARL